LTEPIPYFPAANTTVFTDGSCHTQLHIGAWAAIIFTGTAKVNISGLQQNTTHNRMELEAVLQALNYIIKEQKTGSPVTIISDSQYVVNLRSRREKLIRNKLLTRSGKPVQNADLVKKLFQFDEKLIIKYEKIKAHQKAAADQINYNMEADKIVRKLVREAVEQKNSV